MTVTCPYCGNAAVLVNGQIIYPHRNDLRNKTFWLCQPCAAWVGCHAGGDKPLGRLADQDLRAAKQRAHAAFDPLWKRKLRKDGCKKAAARNTGYKWLAEQLGIERADCHIGMFDVATCERVVTLCSPYTEAWAA